MIIFSQFIYSDTLCTEGVWNNGMAELLQYLGKEDGII